MRIIVNDIAASTGGALTVLKEFYRAVREHGGDHQWIFLLGDALLEETDNIRVIVCRDVKASGLKKLWFDLFSGRRFIKKLKPDAVLSLQNIITFGVKVPQAVYIHQSIPFQKVKKFSFFRGSERKLAVIQKLIGRLIKRSARKSDCVIVQTRWIREAIADQCKLPNEKFFVATPNIKGVAPGLDHFDTAKFFYPTAGGIYKNNQAVYRASEILNSRGLVHEITLTLPEQGSRGSVRCVGRIPYEDVIGHYRESTLVFPSYIETFGYPLAEARQVGTMILASDTPFSREVLDGYENAYFFDPFNVEALADLMGQVTTGTVAPKLAAALEQPEDSWLAVLDTVLKLGRKYE